ncbi:MAG TPA: ATP-binding cassette domain-containing protein [Gammaproteobacteria bacterium]|nr:ATP-binding cassette domain-containing protein [Gammaproteobacteria bacterium]
MALIRLQNIQLSFGEHALFDGVDFSIEPGERIALVGRNGTGKSTLMKVIMGDVTADDGDVIRQQGLKIARLEQDVPRDLEGRVYDIIAAGLGNIGEVIAAYHHVTQHFDEPGAMETMEKLQAQIEAADGWNIEQRVSSTISRLQLPEEAEFSSLSGGLKRRVLLARALVSEPDILLLDEPSNHLDIEAIEWLEGFLLGSQLTLLFVTHDRAFLRKLATRIAEMDRGKLHSWPGNYETYLRDKQSALEIEEKENREFDKRLAQEEVWIRQGIKARRTRNEGRVRALEKMRVQRSERRERLGKVNLNANRSDSNSGKIVIEVEDIHYAYGDTPIITGLSTTILRGDKVGIIGPNGVGKSTLLNLLLGKLAPQSGNIKLGTNLEIAYFDQLRASLDPNLTAQENVAGHSDSVTINGQSKHVISYLQDFLFSPQRSRAPIRKFSGGEKNRLLLAKLFARSSNLLVLDEPTNDLDVETLELLEELVSDYSGTVILVSHDREFLDHVVTSSLVFDRPGQVNEYVGGYNDWLRQRPVEKTTTAPSKKTVPKKTAPKKLSYNDQRDLEELPKHIEKLEAEQTELHDTMGDPDFYQKDATIIDQITARLAENENALEQAYQRWEALEEKQKA